MTDRPPIGARVRLLDSTGIPDLAGRLGVVAVHHPDSVAIRVVLDESAGRLHVIIVDPVNVEAVHEAAATDGGGE